MTTVSVVMPVYNHEDFVEVAARSVIEQEHAEVELICIDDGSHDGSVGRLLQLARSGDWAVRVVPQENRGAHAALNRGAALARGEMIMFLNSDDYFGPNRVHTFATSWERLGRPDLFWGFSAVSFVDSSDQPLDPAAVGLGHLSEYNDYVRRGCWAPELLSFRNVMLTSGNLVVTPQLFRLTGGFEPYKMVHDWAMALRCLVFRRPLVVQEPHYAYRVHGSNTFRTIEEAEGWRESAEARRTFLQLCAEEMRSQSVLRTMLPGADYLRMTHDLMAPRTF